MNYKVTKNSNKDLFISKNKEEIDLIVKYCGIENCISNQEWTEPMKDHFLIYYVFEGCGTFKNNDITYFIGEKEGFVVWPNSYSSYKADNLTPWKYACIGFNGLKAESYIKAANLNIKNPVFRYNNDVITHCFNNIIKATKLKKHPEIRILGLLHIFLSELIEQSNNNEPIEEISSDIYLKKSLEYIHNNYSKDITVNQIANYLGVNRTYFSSLFKNKFNISPKEYITNYRIHKACELSLNSNLSFKEISYSVGYNDPLSFSKIFKKVTGCCPTDYRNSIL